MDVVNVHARKLPVPAGKVADLLETFGSGDADRVWPGRPFPEMRVEQPLGIGAEGGHGGGTYTVVGYQPGRWIRFRFTGAPEMAGFHEFTIEPIDEQTTELRHTTAMRLRGLFPLLWPIAIRALHDACLEALLDRVERELTGAVRKPHPVGWYPRLLFRLGVM
ncbi:hypothetical protein [Nocardia yamanashiensis]|uniref:hypothetical protein n=1 Tax=Nocardia yamanashiensis TaxID=209247 RepID=UPI00082FFBF0|nr:hypothetical protein [Nocardia yamanashiensis]